MPEIALQIDIAASRSRLLAALDTHDGLTAWWTTGVSRDGDDLLFEFPDTPEPFRLRRDRADEDRVAWTSVGAFPPDWLDTTVTWDLFDHPDDPHRTRLLFRHLGWRPDTERTVPMVAGTWAELLVRLKDYVQSGKVQPYFVPRVHAHQHTD
ncbi:SRPBCC domain-containing protein [Kitasatospora sp. NPDC048365]|uniref:SRPBCC family protein n=1 Tax=Kitasatospora sp. NPDC048365 TaxID=3364050 RepID=UPI003717D06D